MTKLREVCIHVVFLVVGKLFQILSALVGVASDRRIWIFGLQTRQGIHEFKDNSKYLFLDLSNRYRADVRPIWLSWSFCLAENLRAAGYEAYHILDPTGLKLAMRARYLFSHTGIWDVQKAICGRALKVNLWHGINLKIVKAKEAYRADYVIATSKFTKELFATSLGVDSSRVVVSGYPRNDLFFRVIQGYEIGLEEYLRDLRMLKKSARVVLYAPTFRDYMKMGIGFRAFFAAIPFDHGSLDRLLKEHAAYLVVKLHFSSHSKSNGRALERYSERVYLLNEPIDIYPILRYSDVLVTDYSSVFFDYLLLDRPIVFYVPDYEKYDQARGFSLDFDLMAPGPKARDFQELLVILRNVLDGEDGFGEQRRRVRDYAFDHKDGRSSDRVARFFMGTQA